MFQPFLRGLSALTIFLFGVALMPFMSLPTETFQWQRYAGVYEDPEISVNYSNGYPGSFFYFQGTGFTPNSSVNVTANDLPLGSIITDGAGGLEFQINSAQAEIGRYNITVLDGNVSLTKQLLLALDAPLRLQEGTGEIFFLPPDSGISEVYLPTIRR